MTQKEKELLLSDLCARLPYGVACAYFNSKDEIKVGELRTVWCKEKRIFIDNLSIDYDGCDCIGVMPYLFPLSSMTEEQENEWDNLHFNPLDTILEGKFKGEEERLQLISKSMSDPIQWCYKNHFDCNGLIPLGLALDATGLGIY